MIEEIENYINGEDYPDEIPKRIAELFEREHADLLAEVKRLRALSVYKELEAEVKRLREVNDELQGDLEQFIERVAEDEAGLKDELEATEAEVKRLREGIMFFLEIDKQPHLVISRAELLELIE